MKQGRSMVALALLVVALLLGACGETPEGPPVGTAAPQLPETVTFAGGAQYLSDAEEIAVALAAGETTLLEQFTGLRVAEVTGSADYEELAAYAAAHPEVALHFCEEVGGVTIAHDAVSLDLTAVPLSELERVLAILPLLSDLEEVNLNRMAGAPVPDGADAILYADGVVVDTTPAPAPTPDPVAPAPTPTPYPTFATALDWEQLGLLQQARPDVRFDYVFTYLGKTFSTADETVDLSGLLVGDDRVDQVAALAGYLTVCEKLVMENCGVGDAQMAALCDALPEMQVVWWVTIGGAKCRTDATRIRLVNDEYSRKYGYHFNTENLQLLRYCTEVELLDLGHNKMDNIEFVRYMPKLRVAILAIGHVKDLSPLAGCTELEYVELFNNDIADLTPLANLQNLRHVELTLNEIEDASPLYGLKDLERLWIGNNNMTEEQQQALVEQLPGCYINFRSTPTANGWREHPRYDQLREEFDYDHPQNGSY